MRGLVVTDGRTFTDRESTDTINQVDCADPRALVYRQIDRAKSGKYLITKTYVTDPARSTVLVDIEFRSLTGDPYQVYVLHDPALTMTGDDDTGSTQGGALVATDGTSSDAVVASRGFTKTSSGYQGVSDGWTDLDSDHRMDWTYTASGPETSMQVRSDQPERPDRPAAPHPRDRLRDVHLRGRVDGARLAGIGLHGAAGRLRSRLAPVPRDPQAGPGLRGAVRDRVPRSADGPGRPGWRTAYRGGFVAAPGRPWASANGLQSLAVPTRCGHETSTRSPPP